MSGSKSTTASNQTTALDPKQSAALYANYGDASALGTGANAQPYTGQGVADINPTQQSAFQQLLAIGQNQTGQPELNSAINADTAASQYNPTNVTAQTAQAGLIDPNSIPNVSTQNLTGVDLSGYMSPYTQSVVDATQADAQHQLQVEENQNNADATKAGAWRGTSLGVQNAVTTANTNRDLNTTIANLRNAGYTLATGNAETDLGRQLQAATQNQNTGLAIGQTNATNTQAANLYNSGADLAAQQSNQSAGLQGVLARISAAQGLGGLSAQDLTEAGTRAGATLAVGDQQQQQAQQQLDWAYQVGYLNPQQYQLAVQQLKSQALGLVPATGTTTGQSSTSTQKSLFDSISSLFAPISLFGTGGASGAAQAAGLFGTAPS